MIAFFKSSNVPLVVKAAIALSVSSETISLVFRLITGNGLDSSLPWWGKLFVAFAVYAISLFLISILAEGRRWIRTLFTVVTLLSILLTAVVLLAPVERFQDFQLSLKDMIIQPLHLAIVLLLWTKASNEYFRRMRLEQINERVIYTNP